MSVNYKAIIILMSVFEEHNGVAKEILAGGFISV